MPATALRTTPGKTPALPSYAAASGTLPNQADLYGYPAPTVTGGQRGFGGHRFFGRLNRNAPPQLSDLGWLNSYVDNLTSILGSAGEVDPEILKRQQASLARGQNASEEALLANSEGLGGVNSPAYLATLGATQGGFARDRENTIRDYGLLKDERLRSDLQAANPLLSFLQSFTAPRGGQNITGGAPSGKTDYFGAANDAAQSVAAILGALRKTK